MGKVIDLTRYRGRIAQAKRDRVAMLVEGALRYLAHRVDKHGRPVPRREIVLMEPGADITDPTPQGAA